jgi:hypothetical protein
MHDFAAFRRSQAVQIKEFGVSHQLNPLMGKDLEESRQGETWPMQVGFGDPLPEERGQELQLESLAPALVQHLDIQRLATLDVTLIQKGRLEGSTQEATT